MTTMHTEERIGEAWRKHRSGNNAEAIKIFNEILARTPSNVDALYGLGLAYRADGNKAGAQEVLSKALEEVREALRGVDKASQVDGHHGGNDLDTYEDDRFMMLSRMIQQRIAELD